MRADVFQAVALCCHTNAYLHGAAERPPEMLTNSTFTSVHEVVFERSGTGKLASGIIADAPAPWVRRLAKESVERLGLSLISCPFDPLIPPSEPWGLLSDGDVGVEIWQPTWRKRIRTHGDTSPWRVAYSSTRGSRWPVPAPFGFEDIAKLLKSLLRHNESVHPLLAALCAPSKSPFPDMFPEEWPAPQRELGELATSTAALLRSEQWAQVILRKELLATDHATISQKLWKASLMALEASAKLDEAAAVHPTAHSFPLAG